MANKYYNFATILLRILLSYEITSVSLSETGLANFYFFFFCAALVRILVLR